MASTQPDTSVKRFSASLALVTIAMTGLAVFTLRGAPGRAIQEWKDSGGNVVCAIGSGGLLTGNCASGGGGTTYTAGQGLALNGTAFRINGVLTGTTLRGWTTISGATLKADRNLASSGSLVWEGAASGSSLYVATSLQGVGLTDCDNATTSKLLWDITSGRFGCGTDQSGGGGTPGGSDTQVQFNDGGSALGGDAGLVYNKTTNTLTVNAGSIIGINTTSATAGAASFSNTFADPSLRLATFAGEKATVGADGDEAYISLDLTNSDGSSKEFARMTWNADAAAVDSENGSLRFSVVVDGTLEDRVFVDNIGWNPSQSNNAALGTPTTAEWSDLYLGEGGVINWDNGDVTIAQTGNNIAFAGASTYSFDGHVRASDSLSSSGTLVWEGAGSGASLYVATSIRGSGLSDCDNATTSKLLWDVTAGRFSCGTDTDTNTTYTAGQGLTLTSTSFKTNATLTGTTLRGWATVSGSLVKADRTLVSSGTLVFEGAGSGASLTVSTAFDGAGLSSCSNGTTSKLLWNSATKRFSCGTDQDSGGGGGGTPGGDDTFVQFNDGGSSFGGEGEFAFNKATQILSLGQTGTGAKMQVYSVSNPDNTTPGNVLDFIIDTPDNFVGNGQKVRWLAGSDELATIRSYTFNGGDYGLVFATRTASTTTDRVTINHLGYLGVGTLAPVAPLHAYRASTATPIARIQSDNTAGNQFLSFDYDGAGSNYGNFQNQASTLVLQAGNFGGKLQLTPYNSGSYSATLGLTLDASGNIGIGDDTPDFLLDVAGTPGFDGDLVLNANQDGSVNSVITFYDGSTPNNLTYDYTNTRFAFNEDLYTPNTIVAGGAISTLSESMVLNADQSSSVSPAITFYDGSTPNSLTYDYTNTRFAFNEDLYTPNSFYAGGIIYTASENITINADQTGTVNTGISFYDGSTQNSITYDYANTRFAFNEDIYSPNFIVADAGFRTAGNVGIGTTSPSKKLQIHSATPDDHIYVSGNAPDIAFGDAEVIGSSTYLAYLGLSVTTDNFLVGSAAGDLTLHTTAGNMLFGTNTAEKMRITTTGLVGIGTAGPLSMASIAGGTAIGSTIASGTAAPTNGLIVEGNTGIGTFDPDQKLEVAGTMSGTQLIVTGTGSSPLIYTDQSTGTIGIGTNQPGDFAAGSIFAGATKMEIASDGFDKYALSMRTAFDKSPGLYTFTSSGSLTSPLIVSKNKQIFDMWFSAYNGSVQQRAAGITAQVAGAPVANTSVPGSLAFYTTPKGGSNPSLRLMIGSGGNIAIGQLGADGAYREPQAKLEVAGTMSGAGLSVGGSGTVVNKIISATVTIDFANLAAIGCEETAVTVNGAVAGDVCSIGVPTASEITNGMFTCRVSAANTVQAKFCTVISGDPGSGSFKFLVTRSTP